MSEFQGSDGQWELVEVGTTIKRLVPASDGESLLTIVYEDGVPFAAVFDKHDARLIAAAPELLNACQALPDFDIDNPDASDFKDNAGKFMKAMRLAKAAIAKALGEQ